MPYFHMPFHTITKMIFDSILHKQGFQNTICIFKQTCKIERPNIYKICNSEFERKTYNNGNNVQGY